MTKADFIRSLAKRGRTDAEILQETIKKFGSCAPSYVRVCARQRLTGQSKHDAAYHSKNRSSRNTYRKRWAAKFKKLHGLPYSTFYYRKMQGASSNV